MNELTSHARRELELAGHFDEDGFYGRMMGDAVMKMVEVFADEGHSGMSAGVAVAIFKRVAMYEPLTPLTGDDEWMEIDDGEYQNKRCPHVFKGKDGAYDIHGKIFREPDGMTFTNADSRVPVTFPYTPERKYVDVPASKS